MPTYAYACKDCGHRFDITQAFTDDALTTCPECAGALRKVFNSVGVVFKGSGFYRNDSRSADSSSTAGSDTSATKSSEKDKSSDSSSAKDSGSTGTSSKDSSSTKSSTSSSSSSSDSGSAA